MNYVFTYSGGGYPSVSRRPPGQTRIGKAGRCRPSETH